MYHPDENNYFENKLEFKIEKVKITTSDNIDLLGWFYKKDLKIKRNKSRKHKLFFCI